MRWVFKERTEKEIQIPSVGRRSWRWVLELKKFNISLYEEVFFHEREKEWHLAVRHYTLFIRKWKWGREHLYYDGPHCFIHLGWICFYYSLENCKRCEPEI